MSANGRGKIAIRFFLQTVALCFILAVLFGILYATIQQETDSQIIRLAFGFLSVLGMGACLSIHAHFVLIRPLHRLSQGLRRLDTQTLITEDFVIFQTSPLTGEFAEIEAEFHALLQKLHYRHREVLLTKNNLAQVSAKFHENKLHALGEMAAGIAHEINNPLAILVGRLEQFRELMKSGQHVDRLEPVLASMEKTVFRIQDAVGDLELIASGPSSEEIRKINLNRLLARLGKVIRNRFQSQDLMMETFLGDKGSKDIEIEGREVELSQALLYLLENAAEAATKANERWVRIRLRVTDSYDLCELVIQDSGTGLDKSLRHNLFQPFFTTKAEGRGMGLSLAKSVIDGHQGRVGFVFDQGHTTVKIYLPVRLTKTSAA